MELSRSEIKKYFIFPEMELSGLIFSYISGENFSSSKNFLYFWTSNFLTSSLKFLILEEETCKT